MAKNKPLKITKEEVTQEMTDKLQELQQLEQTQDLLNDNLNEFLIKGTLYRVHRPVAWEKDECNKEKIKKYVEFLQDDKMLFKKQLVMMLADKGVDILAMERDSVKLFNEEKELLKRLAQTTMEPDITNLKNSIKEVRSNQQDNFMEREALLKYCIEKQLEDFCRFYLLYMVLEVKTGETWEKKYKTYDEFQKADDDLILGRAAQVLAYLVYHDSL
jgi:hypothetical protein